MYMYVPVLQDSVELQSVLNDYIYMLLYYYQISHSNNH